MARALMPEPQDIGGYLLDNYGVCTRGADSDCECLKPGKKWYGRGCPHWKPLGATTLEQLKEAQETCRGAIGRTNS